MFKLKNPFSKWKTTKIENRSSNLRRARNWLKSRKTKQEISLTHNRKKSNQPLYSNKEEGGINPRAEKKNMKMAHNFHYQRSKGLRSKQMRNRVPVHNIEMGISMGK